MSLSSRPSIRWLKRNAKSLVMAVVACAMLSGCSEDTSSRVSLAGTLPSATTLPLQPNPTSGLTRTLTSAATATPDPNLPCGGRTAGQALVFFDCHDVLRIREQVLSGDEGIGTHWMSLRGTVDEYRSRFPITYDPDDSSGILWWGSHGNYIARDMALVYLVTGEEEYARDILRLLELVVTNTPYHLHLANPAAHEEAGVGSGGLMSHFAYGEGPYQSLLFGYFAIRASGILATDQFSRFDAFFKHQAILLEETSAWLGNDISADSERNRNTSIGANLAAATIALSFSDDAEMVALHTRVRANIEWQLGNWWETDGNWGEDVDGYGYRILEGLLLYAETLRKSLGEDLYRLNVDGRNLHSLCEWFLKSMTPIGTTPALNDTPHASGDPGIFELCAYRTGDSTLHFLFQGYLWGWDRAYGYGTKGYTPFNILAWSGLSTQAAAEPAYTSLAMPDVGVTILRENWEHSGQYQLLQFTDSRVHAEASFGSVYLFDHGPWIVGNGYHLAGETQSGFPTDQHSTLALDGRDQTNTSGNLLAFADLVQVGISSVSAYSYSDMLHTRTVLWIKPWSQWIVVDDVVIDGSGNHNLQLRWYIRGAGGPIEAGARTFSRDEPGHLTVQILSDLAANFTPIERHYDWEEWINDAQGLLAEVTYPGTPVRLVTSLESQVGGDSTTVVSRVDSASGTELLILQDEMNWRWILPNASSISGESTAFKILGRAGCMRSVGDLLRGYCLMQGTQLTIDNQSIIAADVPVYIEVDLADRTVSLENQTDVVLSIYVPFHVEALNDGITRLPCNSAGSMLTCQVPAGRHTLTLIVP